MALHAAGTGAEHADLAARWALYPPAVVAMVAAAALFITGWWRLRARGRADLAAASRLLLFAAGLAVLALAVFSPLDPMGEEYLLSAHMLQHLALGDVAPLLVVLAAGGTLGLFVVPRPLLRWAGRDRAARAALRTLGRPSTALVIWTAVTAGWHVPALYELALANRWAHDLEHATMFAAGILVWTAILGTVPRTRMGHGRRALLALAVLAIGMVISQVIFLADPLYSVYVEQPERLFGLTPKADQVQAALMMSAEQILTFGTAAGLLFMAHVERQGQPAGDGASAVHDTDG